MSIEEKVKHIERFANQFEPKVAIAIKVVAAFLINDIKRKGHSHDHD